MIDVPSLFVLGLPRSLSTVVYHAARLSLRLAEPLWTTDGEILNVDRFVHRTGGGPDEGAKYVREAIDPARFMRLTAFLDDVARPRGFAYKDVVQPFVASAWLRDSPLRVLKVRRPLADVAYAMLQRGWHYPAGAAGGPSFEDAVVSGLLQAERALLAVPGVVLDYDALIADERVLAGALRELYPDARVRAAHFIDAAFTAQASSCLGRRGTDLYRSLEERIRRSSAGADLPSAGAP